jgi:hypothetical protein
MKLFEILLLVVLALIFILLLPVLIPLFVVGIIVNWIKDVKFKLFLSRNEGAAYFFYTDRESSEKYVKEEILPSIPEHVRIVYCGDNVLVIFGEERAFDTAVLASVAKKGGFPMLVKVRSGKVVFESINRNVYRSVVRRAAPTLALRQVRAFYADTSIF